MMLSDAPAERAILAGICRYGSKAYHDVGDLIGTNSFTIESNSMIYACLKHIMDKEINIDIDLPTILSSAKEIGLHDLVSNKEEVQHLSGIMKFPILLGNVRKMAVKVRKLQIARMMYDQLETTKIVIHKLGVTNQYRKYLVLPKRPFLILRLFSTIAMMLLKKYFKT